MERIGEAFLTVLLAATLFVVTLICYISRIILPKWNRPRLPRPVQIINGDYGLIIFPNTGDVKALSAFINEQCKLAHKATRESDERRTKHHVANIYLTFENPIAVLTKSRSKLTLPMYHFIQRHIERYIFDGQWCV